MRFLESILNILQFEIETPTLFGWFHILWLGITVAATVLLCAFHKKDKPERVRWVVLITTLIVIAFEIYKQLVFSFSVGENGIEFDYQWYAFPFQFCSTPMYIGLLAGLTKKGKLHDAFAAYLATFATFAGLCVMIYPNDVFMAMLGIDIQTMICHGSMIVIGVYLYYTGHVKLEKKTILKAIPVFAVCLCIASILNEIAYYSGLLEDHTFNMFFISRHLPGSLPVYSLVQEVVPFPFCLFIYIGAFTLAAFLVLMSAIGINAIASRRDRIAELVRSSAIRVRGWAMWIFDMKQHKAIKIAGAACLTLALFFSVINIVPPQKSEEFNPFVVEEGELPMIAAHRGGGECNPENTLLAFKESVNTYNVDIIESDLYLTKDGFLVYNHDAYIDETCNVNGDLTLDEVKDLCENEENRHYICDMTLSELKQYNFGYYFEDENGDRIYKDVENYENLGLQIATADMLFDEFYETNPDLLFIVEIKNEGELGFEACRILSETLDKYPEFRDQVVVGSFHDEIETKLQEEYPDLLRGAPTGSAASFIFTQYLGVNIFDEGDFACLQIPMSYDVGLELPLDSQSLIDRAHRRNIAVQYWTINEEEDMRRLIELGVDCIVTDNPELLAEILEEYEQNMLETDTNESGN